MTVTQLEAYFKSAKLPETPFNLNPSHKILNVDMFVESHLHLLRGRQLPLGMIERPMYDRLIELKTHLESEK